jgi:hypothetical protein
LEANIGRLSTNVFESKCWSRNYEPEIEIHADVISSFKSALVSGNLPAAQMEEDLKKLLSSLFSL